MDQVLLAPVQAQIQAQAQDQVALDLDQTVLELGQLVTALPRIQDKARQGVHQGQTTAQVLAQVLTAIQMAMDPTRDPAMVQEPARGLAALGLAQPMAQTLTTARLETT
jgi:hypothetical protein